MGPLPKDVRLQGELVGGRAGLFGCDVRATAADELNDLVIQNRTSAYSTIK